MNVADIAIILLFMTAVVRGIELGFLRQAGSTLGFIGGVLLGALLQGQIIHTVHTSFSKAMLSVLVILSCAIFLMTVGEYIGLFLKHKLQDIGKPILERADKLSGAVLGGFTLLIAVWLIAAVFAKTPGATFQQQIKGSVLITQLNRLLPEAPSTVSHLGHLIAPNGFPDVFTGLEPRVDTSRPLPSLGDLDSAVQSARGSVVKIQGKGCGGTSSGSGFVAQTDTVITNAHVVAGVARPFIIDSSGQHPASVIWFDADLDLAVLRSAELVGNPLDISATIVPEGTVSAVLGYPGGGDFTAVPSMVLDSFIATGRNIYNQGNTERQVYSLKADVEPGNSGGPLIDSKGQVIGLVFAKSSTYKQVGYALTMEDVLAGLERASTKNQEVSTGSCTQ